MCSSNLVFTFFSAVVVCCVFSVIYGFNIETHNYAIYESQRSSMFGFTVAVHKKGGKGWVLVGAPEATSLYQPRLGGPSGAVYKCNSEGDGPCEEVPFDTIGNAEYGGREIDDKKGRWFGATLSTSGTNEGRVVACSPRYVWFTKTMNRRDPVGSCYVSDKWLESFEEYSPCRTTNWGYHRQGSCQAGFSAAINKVGDRLFVGAPGSYYWQGQMYSIDAHASFKYIPGLVGATYGAKGSVIQQNLETRPAVFATNEGISTDDDSYMGYSTVVGDFQGTGVEGVAVGMPRGAHLQGKVLFFTWDLKNYKNISSPQMGSYFGYSLTTADVDGDHKVDLIVGAPMHTEANTEGKYDVGRVYVFYQGKNFDGSSTIDGFNSKSRFGHSVAGLGDLNLDGYEDFAVGAPYDGEDGNGAVYIYYGSANGVLKKYGQVIYAGNLRSRMPLRTFGFSVTGGMDLDGNEYPDMAVGAYLSDSAFFFRSRPVALVDAFVRFRSENKQVDLKRKDCTLPNGQPATCTLIDFCIKYTGKGIPQQMYLNVQYILDTKSQNRPRMAFMRQNTHTFNETLLIQIDAAERCQTEQVYIKNEIRDKLTPLEAEVRYFMMDDNRDQYELVRNPRSQLKPILDLNSPPTRKDSIVVQKNCGPDNLCIPDLHVEVTTNVDKYLLDSRRNLEFDMIVSNFGEDSFETTFEVTYPEGVHYKKTESKENIYGILCSLGENRTVSCDIGNPLPAQKIAKFKVLFEPYYMEGMAPSYEFDVYVNSTNPELNATLADNHKHIVIDIWIESSLELVGASYPQEVHYNYSLYENVKEIRREADIGPQVTHVYYLRNKGPAEVQEAEMFLVWPYATFGDEDLLYLLDQPHTLGDVRCDAAPANMKRVGLDLQKTSIWDRLQIPISDVSDTYTSAGFTVEEGKGVSASVGGTRLQGRGPTDDDIIKSTGDASWVHAQRHNTTSSTRFEGGTQMGGSGSRWGSGSTATGSTQWAGSHSQGMGATSSGSTRWQGGGSTAMHTSSGSSPQSGMSSSGIIGKAGETVNTKAEWTTTIVDGKPVTKWTNVTTVKDASGKIIKTYYTTDEGKHVDTSTQGRKNLPKIIYSSSGHGSQSGSDLSIGAGSSDFSQGIESSSSSQHVYQQQGARENAVSGVSRGQGSGGAQDGTIRVHENKYSEERAYEVGGGPRESFPHTPQYTGQESTRHGGSSSYGGRAYGASSGGSHVGFEESQSRGSYGAQGRYDEERRRAGGYTTGSISEDERRRMEGYGSVSHGSNVHTGYQQGAAGSSSGQGYYAHNRSQTGGSSTDSIAGLPIQSGSIGDAALGGGFKIHAVDLGTLGSHADVSGTARGAQESSGSAQWHEGGQRHEGGSYGGYSGGRESWSYGGERSEGGTVRGVLGSDSGTTRDRWQQESHWSNTDQVPPTYHEAVGRDNVPTDKPLINPHYRGKRQVDPLADPSYQEIQRVLPCRSTKCFYVRCVVGSLKRDKQVAIALRSRLNVRAVKDMSTDQPIKLSSMMAAKISKLPYIGVPKDQPIYTHEIFTEIPAAEPEIVSKPVPLWIIILSAVAGALILLLLIFLLYKIGFFKRNRPSSAPERQPLNRNGYHHGDEAL